MRVCSDPRNRRAPRKTKYSIASPSQLRTELNKVRAHGVAFDREESLAGFGCVAASIGDSGEAVGAVSVCGPMNRMMFDQRLVAPVRMAALGIWRHIEDGAGRVVPTLQQMRPFRIGLAARGYDAAPAPRGLQFVTLDPGGIAAIIAALDSGFPKGFRQ